jgi:anti-sigma regulatory factor (Ser/Thr protein kinase)
MKIKDYQNHEDKIRELFNNIKEIIDLKNKNIELNDVDFITPFAILPLSVLIKLNDLKINFSKINKNVIDYLNIIRFPKGYCTYDIKENKYIPICELKLSEDIILDKIVDSLLKNIFKSFKNEKIKGTINNSIQYIIAELKDNISQHSKSNDYWINAQYFPKPKICEICIIDTGIGIKKSFENAKKYFSKDWLAIQAALSGTSAKPEDERGTGISTIIKIFVEGYDGELFIMSGNGAVYKGKSDKSYELPFSWPGTMVSARFKIEDNIKPLYDFMK